MIGETTPATDPPEAKAEAAGRSLVVFSLDGRRYALALACVRRCLRVVALTPLPGAPDLVLGVFDLAGQLLPVVDIRRRFGLAPRDPSLSDHLVVATTGRRTVALLVDETSGVIDAPPEAVVPAGEILSRLELFEGAVKTEDGLVLIHDLGRLLGLEDEAEIDRALASGDAGAAGRGTPLAQAPPP